MARVPVDQRPRLGQDGRFPARNGRRERAHVDQFRVEIGGHVRPGCVDGEVRTPVADPEQHQRRARLDLAPPQGHGLPVERRRPPAAHEGLQVAEAQHPRLGIAQEPGNPRGIVPPLADPVERVPTEAIDVFHDQGILRVDNHARNRPRRLPRYVRRC